MISAHLKDLEVPIAGIQPYNIRTAAGLSPLSWNRDQYQANFPEHIRWTKLHKSIVSCKRVADYKLGAGPWSSITGTVVLIVLSVLTREVKRGSGGAYSKQICQQIF